MKCVAYCSVWHFIKRKQFLKLLFSEILVLCSPPNPLSALLGGIHSEHQPGQVSVILLSGLALFDRSGAPACDPPAGDVDVGFFCTSGRVARGNPRPWAAPALSMLGTAVQPSPLLTTSLLPPSHITYWLSSWRKQKHLLIWLPSLLRQGRILRQTLVFLLFLSCFPQWHLNLGHSLFHVPVWYSTSLPPLKSTIMYYDFGRKCSVSW